LVEEIQLLRVARVSRFRLWVASTNHRPSVSPSSHVDHPMMTDGTKNMLTNGKMTKW